MKAIALLFVIILITGCAQGVVKPEDKKPNAFGLKALYLTYTDGPKSTLGYLFNKDGLRFDDDYLKASVQESAAFSGTRKISGKVLNAEPLIKLCKSSSYNVFKYEDYIYCINGDKVEFSTLLMKRLTRSEQGIFKYSYLFETLVPYENRTSSLMQRSYEKKAKKRNKYIGGIVKKTFEQSQYKDKLRKYVSKFKLASNKISVGQKLCRFTEEGYVFVGHADQTGSGNIKFLVTKSYRYDHQGVVQASRQSLNQEANWYQNNEFKSCPSRI
jgi:hypothetical protein